jgi:copper oxidase (laccase) domain-containing protein
MERLGAERARISACIGPAISQTAYEVGDEFKEQFLKEDETSARFFHRASPKERAHFDLTGYAAARLQTAQTGSVEDLQLCTYRDTARFFSYRRSCHKNETDYGRQISAIMIK